MKKIKQKATFNVFLIFFLIVGGSWVIGELSALHTIGMYVYVYVCVHLYMYVHGRKKLCPCTTHVQIRKFYYFSKEN